MKKIRAANKLKLKSLEWTDEAIEELSKSTNLSSTKKQIEQNNDENGSGVVKLNIWS
jgi:hypothetical protein